MALKLTKLKKKMINELLLTLPAACTTCVQYPRCGMTIRGTPTQLLHEKPCVRMRTRSDLWMFLDRNLTLVAHTKLKTRMESNRARQSFGMLKIYEDGIVLIFSRGRRKKKEYEQNRNFQVCIFQAC